MSSSTDPHIRMISGVTDDYQRMAHCDRVAVSEPAFWTGFDRGAAEANSGEPDVENQTGGGCG